MVKYNNIINRLGNKETDMKHFKHLLPLDVKTVAEPFSGSFAVIKHFYKDWEKYNFHINDTDETLFYAFQHYKHIQDVIYELNRVYNDDFDMRKRDFRKFFDTLELTPHVKEHIRKTHFVRGQLWRCPKDPRNYNPVEASILENAIITNWDYKDMFEVYKDDEDAFLFLDPPYLYSDNSNYASQIRETDMTQIVVDILEYLRVCKCKVMLVINKLNILSYLFSDYIKGEYEKIYQLSKKKAMHLIICNYDIE
jgi:site-specific DNA-adenine methylase